MENSPRLNLPYIMPQQAQKHITHNEAVRMLDSLIQVSASSHTQNDPPDDPHEGETYVLPYTPTGLWAGHDGELAVYQDAVWAFFAPFTGLTVWIEDVAGLYVHDGSTWEPVVSFQNIQTLGIGATADPQNRLAVSSPNTLLDNDGDDHRLKINRKTQTDTASILYQTGYHGNAETGLTGDGGYQIKVSSDGSNWVTALEADAGSGRVDFPNSGFLSDSSVNLLQDSGRFCAPTTAINAGPFAKPAYLQELNNAVFSGLAKFINNNNDHGGSAGNLHPEALALISKIRDTAYRRNGVEFHVARLTKGDGSNYSFSHNGDPYYLSLIFKQAIRLAVASIHFYLKPLTGPVLLRLFPGQTVRIDGGLQQTGNILLPEGSPWRSILLSDNTDPFKNWGYSPSHINILQKNTNDEALIACLSIIGGQTRINPNTGVMPSILSWPA